MAEFKLGRIRFVWKNTWTTGSTYYKDDVVRYGGKTYICVVGHTAAADFNTDLISVPTRWNQMSDGQAWLGDWATSTSYKIGDLVTYGGAVYVCTVAHTSAATAALGLNANLSSWNIFAHGFKWVGDWAVSTHYRVDEIVKYGGYTYRCKTDHTSSATVTLGLENDIANWDTFNKGVEYKGAWSNASVRYKLNDVVKYGANTWICTAAHTSNSGTTFASEVTSSRWTSFAEGLQLEGVWSSATTYQPGDVVSYGGNVYIAITNHVNQTPSTSSSNWTLLTQGFRFLGSWLIGTAYKPGDVVRVNGYTYVAIADTTGNEPPNLTYWERLNSGINWRGEWLNSTAYKLGDAVRFGASSYICILAHTSNDDDSTTTGDQGKSPQSDSTGTYWNALSIGTETDVLITKGDMIYYGGSGPQRLPIGVEGQILTVGSNSAPIWKTYGYTEDVYYVSLQGVDGPAPIYGLSIDKPFKTIRYACEQVLKGTKRPNAAYLLEVNRPFIQREVINWISRQISTNTSPFTSSFTYDDVKCERDVGLVVDAVIYDITHGGNSQSRKAALSYLNAASNTTGTYSKLGTQGTQDAASFNFMLTVMQAVLNNTAPTVNYQNLTGNDSTIKVSQVINLTYTAETDAYATVASNVGIITAALIAGVTTNVPSEVKPGGIINVKTGVYKETLPIIVPEGFCVIGDEHRATNVGAASSLVNLTDVPYSTAAITRMQSVLPDIVLGNTVSKSAGNTATQTKLLPFGETLEANAIAKLLRMARETIEYKFGIFTATDRPNPTNYNTSYLITYGNARDLILANAEFIKADIVAYMALNYPTLKYSSSDTARDTQYIINALAYDLTYDGNWQSVRAGLSYFADTTPLFSTSVKAAILASLARIKYLVQAIAVNTTVVKTSGNLLTQTTGTAGNSTVQSAVGVLVDNIITTVNLGAASAPSITYPVTTWVATLGTGLVTASTTLLAAYATIKSSATTFISTNFPTLSYDSTKCQRDIGLILDAVRYDFMHNGTQASTVAAQSYASYTNAVTSSQKAASLAMYEYVRTLARANVGGNTTAQTRIDSLFQLIDDILFGTSNEGSNQKIQAYNAFAAVRQLELNRVFIKAEVLAYIAATYPAYSYNTTLCSRDVDAYIDALKYDLIYSPNFTRSYSNSITTYYPGNYKTRYAARYYINAVTGSKLEDMYYVRNATGLRNQTMVGLSGDLDPANAYGTSRPTAGAYVSLDPGYGPADYDTWITTRSCYVQWVTTFGTKAVGQKIDGALHNGGNKSIVSNDFTQVIDSGIGAWVTNNGRAELVSVFTYYSHIGYLAENGGKIRATNGNNSYGDYGSVSEGVDSTETPITAVVDNRNSFEATVGAATTNLQAVQRLEFNNAGQNYTPQGTTFIINGSGLNATAVADEQRDNAVFQVRLTDPASNLGGSGYVTAASTSQGGTLYQISLAATDSNASSVYAGMKIYLTGGTGVGQNAIIGNYNSGSKIAKVYRSHFEPLTVTATTAGGNNLLTVASTQTLYVNQPIYLNTTFGGLTAWTLYYVISANFSATQFAVSTSQGGSAVTTTVTSGQTVSLYMAGWDHPVEGTTVVTPDASTTYTIEPSLTFSLPGYTATAQSSQSSTTWSNITYAETNGFYTGLTGTVTGGGAGATWSVLRQGLGYTLTNTAAGTGYTASSVITIAGTSLGGTSTTNDLTITVTSVNATTGAVQAWDVSGFGIGGAYVGISGGTAGQLSTNGTSWSAISLGAQTWTGVAGGVLTATETAGAFVTGRIYKILTAGNTTFTLVGAPDNNVGTVFTATGPGSGTGTVTPLSTVFVAVASGTNITYRSIDGGATWSAGGNLANSGTWTAVGYGDGRWVAVRSGSTESAYSTNGGISWTVGGTGGALPSASWTGVVYGMGKWVAMANGAQAAYSIDGGVTWATVAMPSTSNWSSVAWGNGRFVAVSATSGTAAAYSLDGVTWRASQALPTTHVWTKVRYGQGVFIATSTDTTTDCAQSEYGVYWTARSLAGSAVSTTGIVFGNINRSPRWITVSTGTATATAIVAGAKARARCSVTGGKIYEIRLTEPGSSYGSTPTLTITDSNALVAAPNTVRTASGVLANPTFTNRGTGYTSAAGSVYGDGFADFFQSGSYISVRRLSAIPKNGANVTFAGIPGKYYKLVNVNSLVGSYNGAYTAFLQVSPSVAVSEAPTHLSAATLKIQYSQARLTGHDFLNIGTGGISTTNYPNVPTQNPVQANETVESGGGRVFFTSTDQDGNFRVGDLFTIEQSTGVATLNADAFNIAGLQELTLGAVSLGGASATITEFSTDPFFTANSDSIVPTQRAIKAYLSSQIGGGGATLNVNTVVAGSIQISGNTITTTTGAGINIKATLVFQKGITGIPIAFNYFLT